MSGVQIDPDALPSDAMVLQQMLRTVLLQQGELHAENDKLRLLIQRLMRHQFGRRSEQLSPDQLQLGLEELEQSIAANQASQDAAATSAGLVRKPRAEPSGRNHGALPAHLPRYEVVVDVGGGDCACCGHVLHPIGELRTEQLDIAPAQLRVRVTRRPRYACRACEDVVLVAPAPDRPVDGGIPPLAFHLLRRRNLGQFRRRRRWSRTWWSASTRIRCHCTARRRCWNARASSWTARPWRTGLAGPAGG